MTVYNIWLLLKSIFGRLVSNIHNNQINEGGSECPLFMR